MSDDNGLPVFKERLLLLGLFLDLVFLRALRNCLSSYLCRCLSISDRVKLIKGEQSTFKRGSFEVFCYCLLFFAWLQLLEQCFSMLTRPDISLYVLCKFSEGEWGCF